MNECPRRIIILSEVCVRAANANESKDPFNARGINGDATDFLIDLGWRSALALRNSAHFKCGFSR
jgi:hypothetical protein